MTQAPRPIRIDPDQIGLTALDLDPEGFQSALPVQHYAHAFADRDIRLAVGIWDTTTMQEAFGPDPGDEYVTVLDGHFVLVDAAGARPVAPPCPRPCRGNNPDRGGQTALPLAAMAFCRGAPLAPWRWQRARLPLSSM